jgi:hypothetical protein
MSIEHDEGTKMVQILLIFPLDEGWKQQLVMHGCTFEMHEYGETIQFPAGTMRTLLYNREVQPTNHYRILLTDTLELREVLDDEGTGKSWLSLIVGLEPHEERTYEQSEQEARTVIGKAIARSGLITVLTRRL